MYKVKCEEAMKGLTLSASLITLLKGLIKLVNVIITIIARIMLLLGLWVPFIYIVISVILMLAFKTNILNMKGYNYLYIIGLLLCIVISVIITIRNLLLKPIKELINYRKVQLEYDKRKEEAREKRLYEKNPKRYFATKGKLPDEDSEYYNGKKGKITNIDELPKIYRSEINNDIIIHEYKEKFEVFLEKENEIVHIDTKKR